MHLHVALPVMLIPAKLLAAGVKRMKLPPVLGEILAGVILGPAVLGVIATGTHTDGATNMVRELAQVGLCVLLFEIGLHTRYREFRSVWWPAVLVALGGVVLPFLLGWGLMSAWSWPPVAAVVAGATLTATSISLTASVLAELGLHARPEGRLLMGAAIIGDVVGLLLFSVLVATTTPGAMVTIELLQALGQAVAFIAAGVFLGPFLVQAAVRMSRWMHSPAILLALAFSYLLLLAYGAKVAGLAMIIGAYAAGLAFAGHPERDRLAQDLKPLTELLTPLFFVFVGASMSVADFNPLTSDGRLSLVIAVTLLAVAVLGKLLASLVLRSGQGNRWAVGCGMIARGGMGFVFAQMGLSTGMLSYVQFSIIALVLTATTIIGPTMLRRACQRIPVATPVN